MGAVRFGRATVWMSGFGFDSAKRLRVARGCECVHKEQMTKSKAAAVSVATVLHFIFPAKTAFFCCVFHSCSSRRSLLNFSLAACDAF